MSDQSGCLEDLRLVAQAASAKPFGRVAELGGDAGEGDQRALLLDRPAVAFAQRRGIVEDDRASDRDPVGRGEAAQNELAHDSAATELASAAMKNTVQQYVKLFKMAPALGKAIAGLAKPVETAEGKEAKSAPKK